MKSAPPQDPRLELSEVLRQLKAPHNSTKVCPNLRAAAEQGDLELVKVFLEDGADPDESSYEGWYYPIQGAREKGHHEVVELLLENGATDRPARDFIGPMNEADRQATVDQSLELFMKLAGPNRDLLTDEHLAKARAGLEETFAPHNDKPDHEAFSMPGFEEQAQNPANQEQRSRLMARAINLIEQGVLGDDPGRFEIDDQPILNFAAAQGLLEVAQALLALDVSPHCQTPHGYGPLCEASSQGFPEMVRLLLDAGADPNAGDQKDRRRLPLNEAAKRGEPDLVHLLLDAGADPYLRTVVEVTALEDVSGPRANAVRDLLASRMDKPKPAGVNYESWKGISAKKGVRAFLKARDEDDFSVSLIQAPIDRVATAWAEVNEALEVVPDMLPEALPATTTGHFLIQVLDCSWTAILHDEKITDHLFQITKSLGCLAIKWIHYDGLSHVTLYRQGKASLIMDEDSELSRIDDDDEKDFRTASREIEKRLFNFFKEQEVHLPPVFEEGDGKYQWLTVCGIGPERVHGVSHVVLSK